MSGPIISAHREVMSPRLRAALVNPGLLRLNAPSIPSKLLTPVIDTSKTDSKTNIVMHNEFTTISRLIDDPSKLGPGSYNIAGDMSKQPKLVTNWQTQSPVKSQRQGIQIQHD